MEYIKKMRNKSSIIYILILTLLVQIVVPMAGGRTYAMADTGVESVEELGEGIDEEPTLDSVDTVTGPAITLKDTVKAVSGSAMYIDTVTITDENGKDFVGEVKANSKIKVNYHFSIPDEEEVNTTLVHALKLPDEIIIIEDKEYDLKITTKDGAEIEIVKVKLYKNTNTITYQFYDAVNGEDFIDNREGFIYVYSEFSEEKIGNGGEKEIIFELLGDSIVKVKIKFEEKIEKVDVSVVKVGNYDKSTNEITWKITVTPSSEPKLIPISNVIVTDVITNDQTFISGSITLDGISIPDNSLYDTGTKTFTYAFDGSINTKNNEKYEITFKTKANTDAFTSEGNWVSFKNNASISYLDNFAKVITKNSGDTYVGTTVDFIDKSGNYVADGQVINWIVTINKNNLDIKDAMIIDTIPTGLELVESTIKVIKVSDKKAYEDGEYDYNKAKNELTYDFVNDISESYQITYTTNVIDEDAYNTNSNKFTNYAKFTGVGVPDNAEIGVPVGITTNVIRKEGTGYNAAEHLITWKITVNENEININNAVISDDLPKGLEYVDGSFEIIKGDAVFKINDLSYTQINGDKNKAQNITYNLGDIKKTNVITFKTKVLDNKAYAINGYTPYENKVTLTGINAITMTGINVNTKATWTVNSEVISKNAISYDHVTREATWEIVVNRNKMPMAGAYVEDIIGKYEELVKGSVKINGGNANVGKDVSEQNAYYYNMATKMLTYTFPATINDVQIITFKTKIVDLSIFETNNNKELTNTATLKGDDIPSNVTSTATRNIPNVVVSKKGTYTYGKDYIDWEVDINQNKLTIDNPILEDILQEGLELDAATVKLIKLDTKADGNFKDGEDVTKSLLKVNYDMNTRKVVFEFTENIESAHRLTFRTDIDPAHNGKAFKNTISLKGGSSIQTGESTAITVSFQTDGGGVSGSGRGSITLIKKDSNTSSTLAGATFELLDMYMNPFKTSTVTGEDGKALFNRVKYDTTYYIKEKTPPTGYVLSDEVFKFILKDETDLKNITHDFMNRKIKGNITFTKVGEGDKLLQGAIFTIYHLEDVEYSNPIKNAASDLEGVVEFKDIEYGKYVIKETKAPEGYLLSKQVITAEIGDNDDGKIVAATPRKVSNQIIRGNITFDKLDETKQSLQGAEFTLYKSSDTNNVDPIDTAISDAQGKVEFKDVEYGSYVIKETKPPVGYAISKETVEAVISANDNGKTVIGNPSSISNQRIKGNITFKKVDGADKSLEGALFALYHANDIEYTKQITTASSNSEGIVVFNNVEYGKYNIKEIKAPDGYLLSEEVITAEIGNLDNENTVTASPSSIANEIIKGNITFTKVDESKKPLQGAVFTIYKSYDVSYTTSYGTATSNADGIVEFKNIEYGSYIIKETTAPMGYSLSKDILTAVIGVNDNGKTITSNPASISNERVVVPVEPTIVPVEPTIVPVEPTIVPVEPTKVPVEPTKVPVEPTKVPVEPTKVPVEPTKVPVEPTKVPVEPTKVPVKPTKVPVKPTPTPKVPITETTPKDTPKEGYVEIPEDGVPKVGTPAKDGKVTVNKDGKWTYTPKPGFVGKDEFTITIKSPDGTKNDILIEVEVEDVPLGTVDNQVLPKTGETVPWVYYVSGIVMAMIGMVGLTFRRKRTKRNI